MKQRTEGEGESGAGMERREETPGPAPERSLTWTGGAGAQGFVPLEGGTGQGLECGSPWMRVDGGELVWCGQSKTADWLEGWSGEGVAHPTLGDVVVFGPTNGEAGSEEFGSSPDHVVGSSGDAGKSGAG